MATYLDKLNNNPIIVEKNNNQQRVDATAEYINSGLSIFGMLLQSRVDGKGGDDEISEKTPPLDEFSLNSLSMAFIA